MRADNPSAITNFAEFRQAALSFNRELNGQRNNQLERVDPDLAQNYPLRDILEKRLLIAKTHDDLKSIRPIFATATPSCYLTDIQTVVCWPGADDSNYQSYPVIVIHPGHKSSDSSETISEFFAPLIHFTNIKVRTLISSHALATLKGRSIFVDVVSGYRKPRYIYVITPCDAGELPDCANAYDKLGYLDVRCFTTSHRMNFFLNHEYPFLDNDDWTHL